MTSKCSWFEGIYMTIRWANHYLYTAPPNDSVYICAGQHVVFNQIKSPNQIPPLYTSAPIYIQMTRELILNLRDLEKKHQLKLRLHGVCMI